MRRFLRFSANRLVTALVPSMLLWAQAASSSERATLRFEDPTERVAAPQLTDSDGTGLRLESAKFDVVVTYPLAYVEANLTFENLEYRVREGHFRLSFPPGAAVSRFAMTVWGRLMESAAVEGTRGRAIYESNLHRRRDPGLLEQGAGNSAELRIFPIQSRERKQVVLGYSVPFEEGRVSLIVPGTLPTPGKLEVNVTDEAGAELTKSLRMEHDVPSKRLLLEVPESGEALRSGASAVVRVRAPGAEQSLPLRNVLYVVDTSGSVDSLRAEQDRVLSEMIGLQRTTGDGGLVGVLGFDHDADVGGQTVGHFGQAVGQLPVFRPQRNRLAATPEHFHAHIPTQPITANSG